MVLGLGHATFGGPTLTKTGTWPFSEPGK